MTDAPDVSGPEPPTPPAPNPEPHAEPQPEPSTPRAALGPHRRSIAAGSTTWVWVTGLVVAVGLASSVALVRGKSTAEGWPGADKTTTTTPDRDRSSGTTEPPNSTSTTIAEAVDQVVADISKFVENERGLTFKEPVKVELAGEGDFQARLLADFDEGLDDLHRTESVLKAVHVIEPDVDLAKQLRDLLDVGVVGFYDPETNELVVRGDSTTPYVRTTIAHELTHALDDQYFELDRPQVDDAVDEQSFGFAALTEGNAVHVENAYRESLSDADQSAAETEEFMLSLGADYGAFPPALVESLVAPYTLGPKLIDAILGEGGRNRLDAAFAAPPTTSEQVMHPAAYLAGEARVEVSPPAAEGAVIDQGVVGEFSIDQILRSGGVDDDDARDAATGWGGDWYVAWADTDGSGTCVRATYVGDTERDTGQLADAFQEWAGQVDGATVDTSAAGVTVTSCD